MNVFKPGYHPEPAFKPFDVTFRIESQQDVDVLYFLFNYSPLCDGLDIHYIAQSVRNMLVDNGGKADGFCRCKKAVEMYIDKLNGRGPTNGLAR